MEDTHSYITGLVTGIAFALVVLDIVARIRQGRNY